MARADDALHHHHKQHLAFIPSADPAYPPAINAIAQSCWKEEKFHDAIDRGRRRGRRSLRTAQWAAAESGNVTMLIWLGKQMLGQRNFKGEENVDREVPPLIIRAYSEDDPGEGEA